MNRRIVCMTGVLLLSLTGFAQTDTTVKSNLPDTIKVGNFVIIKKNKDGSTSSSDNHYDVDVNIFHHDHGPKRRSNLSTNWFIFDLGFANVRDNTEYGSAEANAYLKADANGDFTKSDLSLRTSKSSNVNIWIFQQKLNITDHVLNLKYGVGLEMYNYRYETNISYHNNPAYIFRDTVDFSKNKLALSYVTIPLMINVNTEPHKRNGFSFSVGASAGYLYNSHTKQISDARGKDKTHGSFDLEPWRLAGIAELGLGPVRVYGSYSFNTLHEQGLKQYPYAVGVRLSNW